MSYNISNCDKRKIFQNRLKCRPINFKRPQCVIDGCGKVEHSKTVRWSVLSISGVRDFNIATLMQEHAVKYVGYLREPWYASAQKDVLNCSHYPSLSLLPGPSGCWCRYTAAGSPSCRSLLVRWCSWCLRWRKTHSTYSSDTET